MVSAPSYADIVDYYLRDDVSELLFELARTRRLKFFHHCATDPTRAPRARPRSTTLHCVESAAALRERVREAATPVPSYPYAFCPFFGIQASAVNAPGEPDRVIGWDWRYELDHPWPRAFWILLPIVALLEHFGVPVLAKYSGRRSLHVIIPAECFPAAMKADPDHTRWMAAFDRLGDLFCRFAPFVTSTMMGLAKEMILTAPYSFHRYHPAISLPISLREARSFDRDAARLERFPGVHWHLPDPDSPGEGMARVLDLADRVGSSPGLALDVAAEVFADTEWETFARRSTPDDVDPDSTLGVLFEGAPGAGRDGPHDARLRRALEVADRAACKTARYNALVAKGRSDLDWDGAVAQRRARCAMLAVWVDDGLDGAFEHAKALARAPDSLAPIALAVRLLSFLPEDESELLARLEREWQRRDALPLEVRLFVALALAEHGALEVLAPAADPRCDTLRKTLTRRGVWRSEQMPDLALAALALAFGDGLLVACEGRGEHEALSVLVDGVFSGNRAKLDHAARAARKIGEATA